MKKTLKYLLVLCGLGLCGFSIFVVFWARQYQALADEEPVVNLLPDAADIAYCTIDGTPLEMDLYFPKEKPAPWQVLVYAHGGSFTSGDKRQGSGLIDIPAMVARGFAVAAINYRLMPENPFPAEVIDAKCAVRFLRAHAAEYQLKTEKVGFWGGSAGGHLASMVGLTSRDATFEAGDYLDQSSHVDAVVEMFGPADLTAKMGWLQRLLLKRAFGEDDPKSPFLKKASPINYIDRSAPPFLLIQGEQDSAVPVEQARVFYQGLTEGGVEATLITVKNANHNFKPTGGPISPTREEISNIMGDFFEKWLGIQ